MQKTNTNHTYSRWKSLLFSPTLQTQGAAHKIAYVGLMTALAVIINALEHKLSISQFSLTLFITAIAGVLLGGISGFCAGFLGDLIGFFLHPMGEYSPWIGISTGLIAFLTAECVYLIRGEGKWLYVKLALACVLIFLCCTCGITTIYLNAVWNPTMSYFEYLTKRLFIDLQIYNSIANSFLIIFFIPRLVKIKALSIKL